MTWQITQAVADHARSRPQAVALVASDATLTYRDVADLAAQVADALRQRGIGPGDRVAIDVQRHARVVAAIVGVMAAGAAYVPLDPGAPAARRAFLIEDCASPLLLCSASRRAALADQGLPVPVVTIDELISPEPVGPLGTPSPDADAYVIYTSGSTGLPKGVRISHASLSCFLEAVTPVLGLSRESVCLNTTGLHFDASVADVLLPLILGARVHLGPAMVVPAVIVESIERHRITHMTAVGSTLTMLVRHGKGLDRYDLGSLRSILTGAEVIDPATVQSWLHAAPNLTVYNGYGPTEVTCGVSFQPISEREPGRTQPYPIGPPLPTVSVRFLDDDGTVTETGPGELLLGGPQVMRGYLGRPAENAAAFVEIDGTRHYRTGDIASRDEQGTLHFAGRRDDEVKLNGYRVNLNEVRHAVEQHPQISHAFIAMDSDDRLGAVLRCAVLRVSAVVGEPDLVPLDESLEAGLVEHAATVLPKYMVPRRFHELTALPVLASGKPDRQRVLSLMCLGGGRR